MKSRDDNQLWVEAVRATRGGARFRAFAESGVDSNVTIIEPATRH
jgi:hypothetical protein